ncbi:lysophospholipid acyltransferase family protein [Candidatus Symbiopectobacterium sp. NZEC135]|uniref:lysophospholipid acyltransferase family protein n=1 Tax=Candidatus Symbiopectobacterium sp. NZEC135 TaxID=2820471 RepID=UPI00222649C7|nr:lysophospholipid acyltransferase family protein [Candidatus Symbiopectobacterium sp. NZEC135]MCW2479285.1 lysophospholipid acyltransferase family protein [Candidatus Symbiopectobacterium sp. NZEC135]
MFSVDAILQDLVPHRQTPSWQRSLLRALLFEREMQQFAERYPHLKGLDLVEQILDYFNFSCEMVEGDLENIPSQGPVVLVANHPIGSLDGLALLRAVASVRPDVRILASQVLSYITPLKGVLLAVDNVNNRTKRSQINAIQNHLNQEGAIILFPAGEVSRISLQGIRDGHWHSGFIRMASKARAPVVPIHISGRNSSLFYLSSLLYRPLSTLLLVREMFQQRSQKLKIRIGARIPYATWSHGEWNANDVAARFRRHVYRLGLGKPGTFLGEKPIALAEDRAALKHALAVCETLGTTPDGKVVYLYRRGEEGYVPILRELGRLREIAFRAVGEGSGQRRDLDSYDDDYLHLILWDEKELEIVGAYRFTPTAQQIAHKGVNGLYSHSLFQYGAEMDPILEQGIELGRSFIQPKYWGKRGLDYLWLGIGAYLARYPQYRYLFGPVSLSGTLPPHARDLLVAFYRLYFSPSQPMATSRRPYPTSLPDVLKQFEGTDYQQDLTRLKSMLNNMGCAIPTLYKQYSEVCETGGVQFIDFGIDPDFNNCIDGLVLVDMTQLKPSRYQRYVAPFLPEPQPTAQEHA